MIKFNLFASLVFVFALTISCTSVQTTTSVDCRSFAERGIASDACRDTFAPKKLKNDWPLDEKEAQHPSFIKWAKFTREKVKSVDHDDQKENETEFTVPEYVELKPREVFAPTKKVIERIRTTTQLFHKVFGSDSIRAFLWTGVESGNPLTRDEKYRWNSLKDQGFYDPTLRQKFIATLKSKGISTIRFGLSNHEIDINDPTSWRDHDAMINDLHNAGIKIVLDLHHFGIEDSFRKLDSQGKEIPQESFYLNPAWPNYFAKFCAQVYLRYHDKVSGFTLMNEPETVVGFNGEMLHGGFPGWSSPESNYWYIERSLNVAEASVKARLAIEGEARKIYGPNVQVPFVHTEASVHKLYWEDFNRFRRFLVSDFILGNDWMKEADVRALAKMKIPENGSDSIEGRWGRTPDEKRTSYDWLLENYIIYNRAPEKREADRARLVRRLGYLQGLHRKLETQYGMTMRDHTVFGIDYYAHNEDKDANGEHLDPQPQYYASQLKAGRRAGLYRVMIDYFNHFQMPEAITETGTPYYFYSSRWHQQMMFEEEFAAQGGIPIIAHTMYPAVDTYGWESALSVPKDQALENPSGIMDFSMTARPFVDRLMTALKSFIKP